MKRLDKENLGYTYYVEQGLNAKETAKKCGVTDKTVGRWVEKNNWKDLRTAKETAPNKLLKNYYDLMNKLVEKRLAIIDNTDTSEYKALTDEISKIGKQIENIRKEMKPSLKTHLYCVEHFLDKLLPVFDKHNLRAELMEFTKEYSNNLAKEL